MLNNKKIVVIMPAYNAEKTLIKTAFMLRVLFSIFIFLLISVGITFFISDKILSVLLIILLVGLVIDSFEVYRAYFSAYVQNKYIAISSIFSNIFSSLLKILFIFTKL